MATPTGIEPVMPLSPPMYLEPATVEDLVDAFADRVLGLLGEPMTDGWRCEELT